MKRKIFTCLVLVVSVFALTFGQAPTASYAQQKGGPVTPTLPSGVPASGPLTPAQIQALPKTAQPNIAALNSSFVNGKSAKAKIDAAVLTSLAAAKTLKMSLSGKQSAALAAVFSQHQKALQSLAGTTAQVTVGQLPKAAPTLAGAKNLSNATMAWKAALDADVAKVLTAQQMALYKASLANPPTLNTANVKPADTTYAYYAYIYASYGEEYNYYGEVFAYYGWLDNPYSDSYDYYAMEDSYQGYLWAGDAEYNAYNAYADGYFDDTGYTYIDTAEAKNWELYGYAYAYYAYNYLTDHSGGYYYDSYVYNLYGYVYNYDAFYYAYYNFMSMLVAP
jgi:hypothetical protein